MDNFELTSQGAFIMRPQVVAVYRSLKDVDRQIAANMEAIAGLEAQNKGLSELRLALAEKGLSE